MSLCDKCVHRNVCGDEDAREKVGKASPFLYVCDDFIDKSILAVSDIKKGKWVTNSITPNSNNTDYFCSKCGHKLKMDYTMIKAYQEIGRLLFCEHCGADMRGE